MRSRTITPLIAQSQHAVGRLDSALEEWRLTVEFDPWWPEAQNALGKVYARLGRD